MRHLKTHALLGLAAALAGCAALAGLDAYTGVDSMRDAGVRDSTSPVAPDSVADALPFPAVDAGEDAPAKLLDASPYDGPVVEGGVADGGRCATDAGPTMVELAFGDGGYCVDSTEVTVMQYRVFLEAGVAASTQPSYCGWNSNFAPNCGGNDAKRPNQPVNCIDWCDAYAYCKWAGKRLCGKIGGGSVSKNDVNDPNRSQWYAACSHGGANQYAYGNAFVSGTCVANVSDPADVMSKAGCQGGFAGLFDMSGNVGEWEDSCDGQTGQNDLCARRGGDIGDQEDFVVCNQGYAISRATREKSGGFRCCKY